MVDVETFLITMYVLVDGMNKDGCPDPGAEQLRGPAPALSRSELITLARFAHTAGFASERAFYRYAVRHLRPLFPRLPAHSQFNRQLGRRAQWWRWGWHWPSWSSRWSGPCSGRGRRAPTRCSTAWALPRATASAVGAAGWPRSRRWATATGWVGTRGSVY